MTAVWQNRGPLQDQILLQNVTPAPLRKCHKQRGSTIPLRAPTIIGQNCINRIRPFAWPHWINCPKYHVLQWVQGTPMSASSLYSLIFSLPKHEIFSTKLKSTILVIIDACAPKKPFSKISVFLPTHTTESVSWCELRIWVQFFSLIDFWFAAWNLRLWMSE